MLIEMQPYSIIVLWAVASLVQTRDLYVKLKGIDKPSCGMSPVTSCQTIRYTMDKISQPNDVIHIDTSQGPYKNEGGADYLTVDHSVKLIGQNETIYGFANILCQKPEASKLYEVGHTGNQSSIQDAKAVTLTLVNMRIQGCKPGTKTFAEGVLTVNNGVIKLVNSQFNNNGIIISHPQDPVSPCQYARLYATNCSFNSNLISKPFQPGITLLGCGTLDLTLTNTTFKTTALKLQSSQSMQVSFFNVSIDGRGLRGSSLFITLANSTNISLTNSTVQNHLASKESAISIVTNSPSEVPPNIHLKQVRLLNNIGQKTNGGVLAVFSRFSKPTTFPMNIQLQSCQFINNSATGDGGSLYLKGVDGVIINQSVFFNNTGSNGGAIHADKVTKFAMSNTIFMQNSAKNDGDIITRAGALYCSDSDITMTNCTFTQNRASYTPSTLYIKNATKVSIQQSLFESLGHAPEQPESNMLLIEIPDPPNIEPNVKIGNSIFNVTGLADETMFDVQAHVDIVGNGNQYICPAEYDTRRISTLADNADHFDYLHVVYWCQSCPDGQYRRLYSQLESHHHHHNNRSFTDCLPCPEHASCKHGQVKPKSNYWGEKLYHNNTLEGIKMVLCLPGHCCTGTECQGLDSCPQYHQGPLCSQCLQNYTLHLGSNRCIHSQNCKSFLFTIFLTLGMCILVLYLCILVFMLVSAFSFRHQDKENAMFGHEDGLLDQSLNQDDGPASMQPVQAGNSDGDGDDVSLFDEPEDGRDKDQEDEPLLVPAPETQPNETKKSTTTKLSLARNITGCFLILMMYGQLQSLVYTSYSEHASVQYKVSSALVSLYRLRFPFSLLASYCSINDFGAAGQVFYQLVQSWMLWALTFIIFTLVFAILTCCKRSSERICKFFCSTFALLLFILFTPITAEYVNLLHCIELENKTVLYVDSSVECYQWWQTVLWVYLGTFVLPFIPILALGLALSRHCSISSPHLIVATFFPLPSWFVWLTVFKPTELRKKFKHKFNYSSEILKELTNENSCLATGCKAMLTIYHGPYHKPNSKWYHFHWNSVLLFQALIIIGVSTFLSHVPILRAFVMTLVLLLCLVIQATCKPFATVLLNRTQTVSTACLVVMSVLKMCAATLYSNDAPMTGFNTVLFSFCEWTFIVMLGVPMAVALLALLVSFFKTCCK